MELAAAEVVQNNDFVPASNQSVDEVRTDETCTSGDQGSHGNSTSGARIRQMVAYPLDKSDIHNR